jgi:hypothetical protein
VGEYEGDADEYGVGPEDAPKLKLECWAGAGAKLKLLGCWAGAGARN